MLDRIDMHLEVFRISHEVLRKGYPEGEETSASIGQRVIEARNFALTRTIADPAGSESIEIPHFSEAIGYMKFDRTV